LGRYEHAHAWCARARDTTQSFAAIYETYNPCQPRTCHGQKNPPALQGYYFRACGVLRFSAQLTGEVTTAQVDTCTVYQKKYPSTGPVSPVPQYGYSVKTSYLKGFLRLYLQPVQLICCGRVLASWSNRRETDGRVVERPRTSITEKKSHSLPKGYVFTENHHEFV
jgi:hypothetical protein